MCVCMYLCLCVCVSVCVCACVCVCAYICIGQTIEIRGLVFVDASVLDYIAPSPLAREGLLFRYIRVYNALNPRISII